MSAILKELINSGINAEIEQHVAWLGSVSGLKAEELLNRQTTPYLYVLRAGESSSETQKDYYVTFLRSDLSVEHRPFIITEVPEGWCYNNGGTAGPFKEASIEDVLHLIMHCNKEECVSFEV